MTRLGANLRKICKLLQILPIADVCVWVEGVMVDLGIELD